MQKSDTVTVSPTAAMTQSGKPLPVVDVLPSRGLLDLRLDLVWQYRELLILLVKRDIQVMYRQAALGAAWAIIQPVFAVTIMTIVFSYFARIPSDGIPYPIFAMSAVLPWTYFAEALRRSASSMVGDADLIRKVYFPRLVMPLASVIAPLLDFIIALSVLVVLMIWYGIVPTWNFLAIPPLLFMTASLAFACGLWLGPINVRFRDVKHTLPFMLQIWMYASPVVYPLSIVPEQWKWAYSLNPMVGIIEGFRWAIFGQGNPDLGAMGISVVLIGLLMFGGLVFFKQMERFFADVI
jgi:homopolymeric O-antigen transport system permease protein